MLSVKRALHAAAVCGIAAAAIPALIPPLFGSPQPMIQIQWGDIAEADRAALEREWRLTEATPINGAAWSYVPADTSPARMRAIVAHPAVADTNGIQRREFRIADRPPLTPRRGGLIDAPPAASQAARALAYLFAVLGALLCLYSLVRSPAPRAWAATTRARITPAALRWPAGRVPVWAWALLAAFLTFAWRFLTFSGFTNDHYIHVALAQQMLLGDQPVRDFTDVGWPLQYLLTAAAWRAAGDSLAVEFVIAAGGFALGAMFTFVAAHRLSASLAVATIVTAFEVLVFPRSYSYPKLLMYAVAGWAFIKLADRPTTRRIATMAVVIAVAFLFRHDHGLFIGLAAVLCLAVAGRGEPVSAILRRASMLTAVTAVLLIPWVLFIAMNGGLIAYFQGGIEYSLAEAEATALAEWPSFDSGAAFTDVRNAEAWLFWLFWSVPFAAGAVLAKHVLHGAVERWNGERACVASLALLSVFVNASFLRQSLQVRLPDAVVPIVLLAAWLIGLAWTTPWRARPAQWIARAATAVFLVFSFAAAGPIADVRGQYDNTDLRLGLAGVRAHAAEMWKVLGTSHRANAMPASRYSIALMPFFRYVDRCTEASDRLIVTGEFPEVLVLANRAFAGDGVVLGSWYSSSIHQDRTVGLLRARPALFVLHVGDYAGFRDRFPLVDAYVSSAYSPMAAVPVEDGDPIEILALADRETVATDAETGWPCYKRR